MNLKPLIELIALIVVPAHQQLVFTTGAEVVALVFFSMAGRVIAKAAIKSNWVQEMMKNSTQTAAEMKARGVVGCISEVTGS